MRISGISALLFGICISAVHGSVQPESKVQQGNQLANSPQNNQNNHHNNQHHHSGTHHDGHSQHERHDGGSRNHARDFVAAISERHTKSKTETVELPLNLVNTTTNASFQASNVKNGTVVFVWVSEKPETLVGAHLASKDIADGMTKIKNAVNGKSVDAIEVRVPKSSQGKKDIDAIEEAFKGWTGTKVQNSEFDDRMMYWFWATAGRKGQVGMKKTRAGR